MSSFVKWPSIEKFSDVWKKAQKRKGDIPFGEDNSGFLTWVSSLEYDYPYKQDVIFFGEWAGPGVQRGDAVCEIPKKTFFVFMAGYINAHSEEIHYIYEPADIANMVSRVFGKNDRIKILPWATNEYSIHALDPKSAQDLLDSAVELVDGHIAKKDPYIFDEYGIEGPGEGLVFYPTNLLNVRAMWWREYLFKVKSPNHSVNKSKKKNSIGVEKPEGIDEFLEMFVTENRMQQMLDEHMGGVAERSRLGDFIKAVMVDVHKESCNEIEESGLEWKIIAKRAPNKIREWLFAKEQEQSGL